MAVADISAIRARLNGIQSYHPFEADTFADWTVQAGDYVTVSRDATGYKSPISRVTHQWNGAYRSTLSATGNEERPTIKAQSIRKYASGGAGMRNGQDLYWEIWSDDGFLNSTLFATASVIGARMEDWYNGLFSYLELTASHLLLQFEGMYDGLRSELEITRSRLSLEFQGLYDGLRSELEITRSRLSLEFQGLYDGLRSSLELTRSRLSLEFRGLYDGLSSNLEMTRSALTIAFNDYYNGLNSSFQLTASALTTRFNDYYNGLNSSFQITASALTAKFNDYYNGMNSSFQVTASALNAKFNDYYNGLNSSFQVTASALTTKFNDYYNGLNSSFQITASALTTKFNDYYNGMSSAFQITASALSTSFNDYYNGLNSAFDITASALTTAFNDYYNGLNSTFQVTASALTTAFNDYYNGLNSSFVVTASALAAAFNDYYNGMNSTFDVTASALTTAFNDYYNGMNSSLTVTASALTAKLNDYYSGLSSSLSVTASSLRSTISSNYSGLKSYIEQTVSDITLSADKIYLYGDTALSGYLTVDGGNLVSKKLTLLSGGATLGANQKITVLSSGSIDFGQSTPGSQSLSLTGAVLAGMIKSSAIAGNVLTFTHVNGDTTTVTKSNDGGTLTFKDQSGGTLTFNKATSVSDLTGDWSGSTLTVTTNPLITGVQYTVGFGGNYGAHNTELELTSNGSLTKQTIFSTQYVNAPIKVCRLTGMSSEPAEVFTDVISFDPANLLQAKTGSAKITSNGTYSPDSAYIGFSSVEIDVPTSTTVTGMDGNWSGSTLTVKTNPVISGIQYTIGFGGNYGSHNTEFELTSNGSLSKTTVMGTQYVNAPVKVSYLTGASAPVDVFTDVISFDPAGLLQTKTGSSKITSNGTYTPGTNYIGFASVEVDVPTSTTVTGLDGNWSGSTLTITTDPYISGIQYTIGFGGNYGSHNTEFELTSNGSLSKTTVMGTQYVNAPIKVCYLTGQSSPVSVFTDTVSFDPSGLLEAKTGSAKITANGTYTPGTNYIGFSSVEVDVSSSGGSWNDGWDAARGYLAYPDTISSGVEQTTFYMKVPNAARTGQDTTSYRFVINEGTPGASGYVSVGDGSGHVYGRVDVSDWYSTGWGAAYAKYHLPGEGTSSSITISGPGATPSSSDISATYTLSSDSSYVYLKTNGVTVARATNSGGGGSSWNDGWDAARGYLAYPDTISAGAEQTTFYMKVPNSARTGQDTTSYKFVINEGTPGASGYVSVSDGSGHVYGRVDVSDWYSTGWSAAFAKFHLPGEGTSSSITVTGPGATSSSSDISATYTLSSDSSYVYLKTNGVTVARTTNSGGGGSYETGWSDAYSRFHLPGEGYSSSITISGPGATSSSSDISATYILSSDSSYVYLSTNGVAVARRTNTGAVVDKSDISMTHISTGNEPTTDGSVSAISSNGWRIFSVSAKGTTKTFKCNIDVPTGTHSISITPDTVGHTDEPSGTRLWSSTTFLKNKWYKMTVNCGTASKVYKIYINAS